MESKTYFVEGGISYFEKHYRENMDITDYITEYDKGYVFSGVAKSIFAPYLYTVVI